MICEKRMSFPLLLAQKFVPAAWFHVDSILIYSCSGQAEMFLTFLTCTAQFETSFAFLFFLAGAHSVFSFLESSSIPSPPAFWKLFKCFKLL